MSTVHASDFAEQFDALWESSNSPPDMFAFLHERTELVTLEKLAVCLADQRHRGQTEQPLSVEEYVAQFAVLDNDVYKTDLAVGEFRSRQNEDPLPSVAEFKSRFADIGDSLEAKLSSLVSPSEVTVAGKGAIRSQGA